MKITALAAIMVFLAYFLVLYGGVGFIQDKRFFLLCAERKSGGDTRQKGEVSRCTYPRLGDRGCCYSAFPFRSGSQRMGRR